MGFILSIPEERRSPCNVSSSLSLSTSWRLNLGFRINGIRFSVEGKLFLGLRVANHVLGADGKGLRIKYLGFGVSGLGFGVWGLGFRVQGLGYKV